MFVSIFNFVLNIWILIDIVINMAAIVYTVCEKSLRNTTWIHNSVMMNLFIYFNFNGDAQLHCLDKC